MIYIDDDFFTFGRWIQLNSESLYKRKLIKFGFEPYDIWCYLEYLHSFNAIHSMVLHFLTLWFDFCTSIRQICQILRFWYSLLRYIVVVVVVVVVAVVEYIYTLSLSYIWKVKMHLSAWSISLSKLKSTFQIVVQSKLTFLLYILIHT